VLIPSTQAQDLKLAWSGELTSADPLVDPAEFWAGTETLKKIFKRKLCLAAARGDCDGHIVQAHTIPRSQLQRIAVNGHVYCVRGTPADLLKSGGLVTIGTKGIGEFSILNCFCEKHDREVFTHIENDELTFDPHQLALLHYRAMGAELYKKASGLEGAQHQTKKLQNRNYPDDSEMSQFATAYELGSAIGLRDMMRTFSKCESILCKGDHARINGLVVRFNKMPTIMAVGGFSPEFSYEGQPLQRLGQIEETYEQIGLSILAAQSRAAVIFTWIAEADVCHKFAESFVAQDTRLYSTLAIQTAFEHLENTCMNIHWWDSLKEIERQKLLERIQYGGSPFEERTGASLQFCGINFDQWEYDHSYFIGRN
jgi:hypothetical protein